MTTYFRAIALDFDGTITEGGPPGDDVLAAIAQSRREDRKVLLVTGRILEELRAVFPPVDRWFDAIVGENGCVLSIAGATRVLSAPVEFELDEALVARSVTFRRGQVLLATHAVHEGEVRDELRRLGLECQVVRNRGELMVLPAGISKGFGVYQALEDLGISHHSTVAFGDAENDHSLLRGCELGVAVAGSVESLKRHADIVLRTPGGAGVAEFLRGPVISGDRPVEPRRWQIDLGSYSDGSRARIPGSQINVMITGRSNSGKSYLAGLFAEQVIGLGYSLCVVDPEGDYASLARLRGTVHVGGAEGLPRLEEIGRLMRHRFGSVLIDLSLADPQSRSAFVVPLLERLEAERQATGLPHWILLDEAHHLGSHVAMAADGRAKGYCLVTYRPKDIPKPVRAGIDVFLVLWDGAPPQLDVSDPLEVLRENYGLEIGDEEIAPGQAWLLRPKAEAPARIFNMGPRSTHHVRHWHKYFDGLLPDALHFQFRSENGEMRHVAGNVAQLHRVIMGCAPSVIRFHARRGDLSRWLRKSIQDLGIAKIVKQLEEGFAATPQRDADVEILRFALLRAIEQRYIDGSG